jgi:hypothetical protein
MDEITRLKLQCDWLRYGLEEVVRCTEPKAGSNDPYTCRAATDALAAAGFGANGAGIQKPALRLDR